RALREIYLPGFKAAVQKGGALTAMGSYNRFRGQYATENKYLVEDVLKNELGFQGALMSDWGAVHNSMEALMNGTDIEMGTDLGMLPNPDYSKFYMADTALTLVRQGKVPEKVINDKVRRILRVMYSIHKMGSAERKQGAVNTKGHQATARKIAEEGIVLLKKDHNILPFDNNKVKTIAVIGANADRKFGRLGGSSQVPAKYEITPLQGIKNLVGNQVNVNYSQGYKIAKDQKVVPLLVDDAVQAASKADVVVYVGGWIHGYSADWSDNAFDAEGADKPNMQLPFGQDQVIKAVLKANPKTVVVMMGGGPVDMSQWVDQTPGVLQAWYPGMEGGNALAEILFGKVNPSGKLPMTFPKKLDDIPAQSVGEYPGKFGIVHYFEGIFNGYRYFDTFDVQPQFAFGHGLSYTSFKYSDLNIKPGNKSATVQLSVQNTGDRSGKEVVEIYVNDEQASVRRPAKELKAFQKVELQPGETKQVTLQLPADAFKYYDGIKRKWVFEPGRFKIMAGSSSRDIRLSDEIEL
ncbi:MAG TPA: glycoside hydrolase family 3 C-terminal domain-containing protein, partial [Balneolaceae bacterium]|nr:glycoside hydrolase family 3 C-terminal domain-containing protein [Balneolaceae bacterium]